LLKCPTKAYSIHHRVSSEIRAITQLVQDDEDAFYRNASAQLRATVPAEQLYVGTPPLGAIKRGHFQMVLDCTFVTEALEAQVQGFYLKMVAGDDDQRRYVPFRFCSRERISHSDKMLLAFDAYVFSQVVGTTPSYGELIVGQQSRRVRVALTPPYPKIQSLMDAAAASMESPTPPRPVLNRHCAECQFAPRCTSAAKEMDDLSLLSKMSVKERQKYHDKGIFTVTQLSHTFRYRKRASKPKHDHALKALAVRKNKVHVLGRVVWRDSGTPVYIDVEGDPDCDLYYCISIRFEAAGSIVERSYWADGPSDEEQMWSECLAMLGTIDDPWLVHYGSYETNFLRRMKNRYPNLGPGTRLDHLVASAVNLVTIIYAQVYFPTCSNGLKDIAQHLGFRWSHPLASGLAALCWRRQWERSLIPDLKQRLLIYNAEDCAAAQIVAEALSTLSRADGAANVVDATELKREYPQRFGKIDFALSEFQQINDAARWDYQREKVYLRFNKRLRRLQRKAFKERSSVRIDRMIRAEEERPACCIHCGATAIKRWGWLTRIVHDLKLSRQGIKRRVVRHLFPRYICWQCRKTFHKFSCGYGKYGKDICAYVLYQIIELQLSQRAVARSLHQIFSIPASGETINRMKVSAAKRYEATYHELLNKIVRGDLVHADETRATIIGRKGYVWVFTSHEEVAFVFSEGREASIPQDVLKGFRGVLVSDFYSGYDSIECAQQKCLVHLMRDINEDLCKQPFNQEIKDIARKFANVLRPIVESVDRFGLKAHHLRKHRPAVDCFFESILGCTYQTEVAAGYHKRFRRNRDRLFAFLDYDGVPWNNNNAEHAIKAFARLRNIIGGTSTVKGMREYLILLSISETCKNKGVRFLDFLLSEESDVDRFASGKGYSRRGSG